MKTVAQIAREIGVSKQAVHSKLKKEPLKSGLSDKIETIDNALHINIDGEKLIKAAFDVDLVDEPSSVIDEVSSGLLIEMLMAQITALNAQNEDLRQQLNDERAHSRKQADEILQLAQQGQKLAETAQMLMLANGKKRGLFSKF